MQGVSTTSTWLLVKLQDYFEFYVNIKQTYVCVYVYLYVYVNISVLNVP